MSGEAFLTAPGDQVERLRKAVAGVTGVEPRLDTGRDMGRPVYHRLCPVAEFGLVGSSMHQVDEHVPVAELRALADAYAAVLRAFAA